MGKLILNMEMQLMLAQVQVSLKYFSHLGY